MNWKGACLGTAAACFFLVAEVGTCAEPVASVPIRRGTIELAGSVSFSRIVDKIQYTEFYPDGINTNARESSWSTTTLEGSPAVGWFITDRVELVARFRIERIWTSFEIDGQEKFSDVDWSFGSTGLVYWNFPGNSPVVPYIGGGCGLVWFKHQTTTVLPRVQGGLRFLFGDSASLNTGLYFEKRWSEDTSWITGGDTNDFGFLLGISTFLEM